MNFNLSENQKKIVQHDEGPMLVVGVPGSGRSLSLAARTRRLLAERPGDFHVLVVTYFKYSAAMIKEQISDLSNQKTRVVVNTMTDFCREVLSNRGKHIGMKTPLQLLSYQEQLQMIYEVVSADPELREHLESLNIPYKGDGSLHNVNQFLSELLADIRQEKTQLRSPEMCKYPFLHKVYMGYEAKLRAANVYDIDDLPMRTYQLFTERPQIAEFYRKLYRYMMIDDVHQLTKAEFQVVMTLCSSPSSNVIMTIPKHKKAERKFLSIVNDLQMDEVELDEQYLYSGEICKKLETLASSLKIIGTPARKGEVRLYTHKDEFEEARVLVDQIEHLYQNGQKEINGEIEFSKMAVVARNRYVFSRLEEELSRRKIPYFRSFSSNPISESQAMQDFELCMRVIAHYNYMNAQTLMQRWRIADDVIEVMDYEDGAKFVEVILQKSAKSIEANFGEAIEFISQKNGTFEFLQCLDALKKYANGIDDIYERALTFDDLDFWRSQWEAFVSYAPLEEQNLAAILRHVESKHLKQTEQNGIGLFTTERVQGYQFDVLFLMGMEEGTFPKKGEQNDWVYEKSMLLAPMLAARMMLYFSSKQNKKMPWGEVLLQTPSHFLEELKLI